jgi:uncharacterized iron-regulated protein
MSKSATQKRNAARLAAEVTKNAAAVKKAAPAAKVDAAAPETAAKAERKTVKTAAHPGAAAQPAATAKAKDKPKKLKMVRDSFTMPETEYKTLGEVKKACLKAGIEIKKSELLRIGVELIRQMEVEKLKSIQATLTPLKAGRPKKEGKS